MIPHQLLADGLTQCVDRGVDTCINGHGQVLHLEGNVAVVAHHVANGEEFLPPLQILAAADCNIVPNAVSGLGNSLQNLPRAVKGKKAQKKEKHDFREKGIAKQASTLRRPRNKEITINL